MCTSIYLETLDKKHLLARTMDFSFPLNCDIVYLPRNYNWESSSNNEKHSNKYGVIGAGRSLGKSYFLGDGVNEHGLAIAELYLPNKAVYQDNIEDGKTNLAPHEFITWALGKFKTIADLKKALSKVRLINSPAPLIDTVMPLHWIVTNDSGQCFVIEPTGKILHLKENPVGVMTNTPELEWHLENLNNYLNVRPKQFDSVSYGSLKAIPFSQGTGTLGLPGGFTPPERFVRAAFFKENIKKAKTEKEGVNTALKILSTVQIPKGIVVTSDNKEDYSQFTSIMCHQSKTYYFKDYGNNRISEATINDSLLKMTTPKIFSIKRSEDIFAFNKPDTPDIDLSKTKETVAVQSDLLNQELSNLARSFINNNLKEDMHENMDQIIDTLKYLINNSELLNNK
ncbi:choloylglycine hydrolase family protein [Vagococcus fluvialis]|uniref:Choloylglycine hydrolase family protein n=1 Tax=Vagococcus fluvialis TaxID=2738 RepID=A0A7X6DA50_9ENTE|nr:choloylglycine hydrolase family protein [Vagococcus fluvialis]NKC68537.1 choloylglycine hydrolase family protein [Vagococcus fluvialis]